MCRNVNDRSYSALRTPVTKPVCVKNPPYARNPFTCFACAARPRRSTTRSEFWFYNISSTATTSKSLFCLHRIRNLGMLRWLLMRIFRLLGHFRNLNLSLDKLHRWKEVCIVCNCISQYFYRSDPLKNWTDFEVKKNRPTAILMVCIFSNIVPHKKLFKFLTIVNESWTGLVKNFASDGLIPICWKLKLQKYLIANFRCIFVSRKSLFPLYHTLCNNTHTKHCRK